MSMTALGRRGFVSRDIVRLNSGKRQACCFAVRSETLIGNVLLHRECSASSSCVANISRVLSDRFFLEISRTFSSVRSPISPDNIAEVLTKQQAKELASKFTSEERDLFLAALNECKSEEEKAGYEGESNGPETLFYIYAESLESFRILSEILKILEVDYRRQIIHGYLCSMHKNLSII